MALDLWWSFTAVRLRREKRKVMIWNSQHIFGSAKNAGTKGRGRGWAGLDGREEGVAGSEQMEKQT